VVRQHQAGAELLAPTHLAKACICPTCTEDDHPIECEDSKPAQYALQLLLKHNDHAGCQLEVVSAIAAGSV
jgi:hypothetical protein